MYPTEADYMRVPAGRWTEAQQKKKRLASRPVVKASGGKETHQPTNNERHTMKKMSGGSNKQANGPKLSSTTGTKAGPIRTPFTGRVTMGKGR